LQPGAGSVVFLHMVLEAADQIESCGLDPDLTEPPKAAGFDSTFAG
jgi:hypothetical protein